jgi:DNA-binding FadR family transcriptional regulator
VGIAIVRTTLADQAADAIVELIFEEGLRPGDPLPAEADLASRLGVSRVVVREATRTLRARQILDSGQGRVARVRVPDASLLGQLFEYAFRQQSISFPDLLQARRVIEGELAALAAERGLRPEAEARARDAIAAMGRAEGPEDLEAFIAADLIFHYVIADASGNALLTLLLRGLERLLHAARVASHRTRFAEGRSVQAVVEAHERILEALLAGDPERARQAMAAHLDETARDNPSGLVP